MSDETVPDAEPAEPSSHRRAVWTTILLSQLVIAMLTAAGVYVVHKNLNDNIAAGARVDHRVDKDRSGLADGDDEPLNVLVMGSDSRVGTGNGIDGENGDGSQRNDTTILLHVSQDRTNAYGVSLPRDAIVDRPDCTADGETVPGEDGVRFNTAFSVGGPTCAVQTVEELTQIHIDHFLVLDFNGFKEMVDAVDGVEVCLPEAVDDDEHDIHFEAGTQTLKGQQALDYVRERYQLSATGDVGRMKRQQAFIASMVGKVSDAGTLSQPSRVIGFLNAFTSSIQVDDGIDSVGRLADLAMQMRDTGLDKIKFLTVPIEPDPDDPLVTLVWAPSADDLWDRIREDQKLGKDFTADSIDAGDDVGTTGPDAVPDGGSGDGSGGSGDQSDDEERRAAGLCV